MPVGHDLVQSFIEFDKDQLLRCEEYANLAWSFQLRETSAILYTSDHDSAINDNLAFGSSVPYPLGSIVYSIALRCSSGRARIDYDIW